MGTMSIERAVEVLRGDNDPSARDLAIAAKMGADALEFLAAFEESLRTCCDGAQEEIRNDRSAGVSEGWQNALDLLERLRAEWEKERKG